MQALLIPPEDLEALDAVRIARALPLVAVRLGPGRYEVSGGRRTHHVDLYDPTVPRCCCGDHLARSGHGGRAEQVVCKHMIKALLEEADAAFLALARRKWREYRARHGHAPTGKRPRARKRA